jgi:hypothetical protein
METIVVTCSEAQAENIKQYIQLLNNNRSLVEGPRIVVREAEDAEAHLADLRIKIRNIARVMR